MATERINYDKIPKYDTPLPGHVMEFPDALLRIVEEFKQKDFAIEYWTNRNTAHLSFLAPLGFYTFAQTWENDEYVVIGIRPCIARAWSAGDSLFKIADDFQQALSKFERDINSAKENSDIGKDWRYFWYVDLEGVEPNEWDDHDTTYKLPTWATEEYLAKLLNLKAVHSENQPQSSEESSPSQEIGLVQRKRGRQFQPLSPYVSLSTSTLIQGVTRSIRNVKSWEHSADGEPKMQFTDQGREGRYSVTSILPDLMWETIKNVPAQIIKLLHVIEAVRYESNNPHGFFTISTDEITRHYYGERSSGKYKSSEKEAASAYLRAILNLELQWQWKDRKGISHRTKGTLYNTHATDESEDLFGYVPNATVISLNRFLFDSKEGVFSQSMPYHKAFLSLDASRQAAAIFLGSFILTKGRSQSRNFEPGECRFTNETLLEVLVESGCISMDGLKSRRHECKIPEIVGRALDKLKEVNLIERWEVIDKNPLSLPTGSIDTIEDIEEAFPEDLPTGRRRRRISTDSGKLQGGIYAEWIKGTTRIHFTAPIEALQRQGRASAAAKKPARKGKRSPTKGEPRE